MQELQRIRVSLEGLRLEAEEVIPADKEREAQELRAAGAAAIRAAPLREYAFSYHVDDARWLCKSASTASM